MILIGEKAKQHLQEILNNHTCEFYEHPEDKEIKGGCWFENKKWNAFDNSTNDCNIESFTDIKEAIKYAKGLEAILDDGTLI
ncbi:MAG: hypothetical protein CMH22_06015 [Methylophaga sp.]|nr:hypothetical protein [Methylophaga sp.]|tara:strand:+ start:61234 stop:61479 length:246 start_codon:yes stop_codon:yes gene_type:complete